MKIYKRLFLISLIFAINISILKSQGSAGNNAKFESRYIVDMPTAGLIPDKFYAITAGIYPNGGIMLGVDFAIFKFVNAGMSMSGNNIVGDGDIDFQRLPGLSIRARALDETKNLPAIVLGFSNQGSSNYIGDDRFKTHSPGFYLSLSKNFMWDLGNLAFHGGLTYSVEPKADEMSPNAYFGAEQSLGDYFSVNVEFNLMLDETEDLYYSRRGLLNTSIRASIVNGITAELKLRDIFSYSTFSNGPERILSLEIIKFLN